MLQMGVGVVLLLMQLVQVVVQVHVVPLVVQGLVVPPCRSHSPVKTWG